MMALVTIRHALDDTVALRARFLARDDVVVMVFVFVTAYFLEFFVSGLELIPITVSRATRRHRFYRHGDRGRARVGLGPGTHYTRSALGRGLL